MRAAAGADALDYALVLGGFHFINRIADLLRVEGELLPEALRRVEWLRRLSVRLLAALFRRALDLRPRADATSWTETMVRIAPRLGRSVAEVDRLLVPLRSRPRAACVIALALEERDQRSSLSRATIARVQHAVEAALPRRLEDVAGFYARPADPVEAFAVVGTRHAERTTAGMIGALRGAGFDDLGILDLAIAIADANQWARLHRLLGLSPDIMYLPVP